jgi:hypothetical protein
MDVGDTIDLRIDLDVTTTGTNKTLKMFIKFGIGTPSAFLKFIDSFEFKTSVTNENVTANIPFYLGSEDIKNAPAELYILADTSGSLKVNGWYTRIIRKSINVIDISGTVPTLQAVTDAGMSTTNDIQIQSSDNSYVELRTYGIYIRNLINEDSMIVTSDMFQFGDEFYDSNFSFRPRTQNTNFYFEDEGGDKSIATREWVNTKIYNILKLGVTTNATPSDGDVWLESNTNTGLKIRINGITKTINLI